jgi:hypothetical protein
MALVTNTDLTTYMDISLSLRQQDAADTVLSGLQSELEAYLGRKIESGSFAEDHILDSNVIGLSGGSGPFSDPSLDTTESTSGYGQGFSTIYLRESPVASVASMTVTSSLAGSPTTTLIAGTDYVVRRYGVDLYRSYPNSKVTVTYTAGLDGTSLPIFKLMILRAATREMQNMHDDVVGIKDLEPRNVAPVEVGFTERELLAVKRYRRIRVA